MCYGTSKKTPNVADNGVRAHHIFATSIGIYRTCVLCKLPTILNCNAESDSNRQNQEKKAPTTELKIVFLTKASDRN